jgi:hypothetical protein
LRSDSSAASHSILVAHLGGLRARDAEGLALVEQRVQDRDAGRDEDAVLAASSMSSASVSVKLAW